MQVLHGKFSSQYLELISYATVTYSISPPFLRSLTIIVCITQSVRTQNDEFNFHRVTKTQETPKTFSCWSTAINLCVGRLVNLSTTNNVEHLGH